MTPHPAIRGAERAGGLPEGLGRDRDRAHAQPGRRIGHAESQIVDSRVMLADEFPEMGWRGAQTLAGSPVTLHPYVGDVDAVVARAVAAGAASTRPSADPFYGDCSRALTGPFGRRWFVAAHREDVPPDEPKRRAEAAFLGGRK